MLRGPRQLVTLLVAGLFLASAQAQPKPTYGPSASELALLPDYCQARLGTNSGLRQSWSQRIGPDKFMHLHHYCNGLNDMNRAKFTFDQRKRRGHLQSATQEFNYVLRNWPADFVLAVDAQKQKTAAESMLKLP